MLYFFIVLEFLMVALLLTAFAPVKASQGKTKSFRHLAEH
ncbi:hypothetical protein HMPREF3189_00392 [Clostridiales bacterium KA00134]|nr:hypothetical protein HMPREF3189_00392 [Clostridiales bacterium KA00134]